MEHTNGVARLTGPIAPPWAVAGSSLATSERAAATSARLDAARPTRVERLG